MPRTSLAPVVLAVATLLIPGLASPYSHFQIQVNPGIVLEPLGGSVGLVSNCMTLKPAYVVGETVEITIQSDGDCQEAELDWGDFLYHIPVVTLDLKGKTSATYTHTYSTPGIKTVRVVGTTGCVGMAATHVVVVPSLEPDTSQTPVVTQIHGPGWLQEVRPYDYYLITGSGFGTQTGQVHMLGNFPGAWWEGPQNPYPGPWGPIPGGVRLNVFHWLPRAIAVYVPWMTGVQDQSVQLVVVRASSATSAPLSTPFVALRETRSLHPEDVDVTCGPSTTECQLAGYAWAMSVSKSHPSEGPPVTGTDELEAQVENGWVMKSMEVLAFPHDGATVSYPTGFAPGATSATIQVEYSLPMRTCSPCYPTGHRVGLEIEGPHGVPHKGPYPGLSLSLAASHKLAFPLALDVRKALDDLETRLQGLEARLDAGCAGCAPRRHAVQTMRARVHMLRGRIGAGRPNGEIPEALRRHAVFLTQEAARLEARYPRAVSGARPEEEPVSPGRQSPPTAR